MKQILVVEDELLLAMVNQKIIERAGYAVMKSLTTAEEAVEFMRTNEPDLILMDVYLAGEMDGVTALEEIRKFSSTPVVFVSGNSDKFTYRRIKAISNSTFVNKPVKPSVLEETISAQFL